MRPYHKIEGVFKRSPERPHKLLTDQFKREEIEFLRNYPWTFTEKIDGTNIRVHWDGHKVTFGGRTEAAQIPAHLIERLNELFIGEVNEQVFEEKFGETPVTLYGEGYGAKIQKGGGLYSDKADFILFDVLIGDMWLKRDGVEDIAKHFDIKAVPVVLSGTIDNAVQLVKSGFDSRIAKEKKEAEGLIGTPDCGLLYRNGDRIIIKLKTKDFI